MVQGVNPRDTVVRLDRLICTQLVSDPEFYQSCPEYEDLREEALRLHSRYLGLMQNRAGQGCGSCGNRRTMEPAIQAFLLRTKALYDQHGPPGVQNLYRFISGRLGYAPGQLVMYHKVEGQGIQRIELGGQGCRAKPP